MEGYKIGDGGECLLTTAVLHQLLEVVLFVLSMLVCASWSVLLVVAFWLALHLCFCGFFLCGRLLYWVLCVAVDCCGVIDLTSVGAVLEDVSIPV